MILEEIEDFWSTYGTQKQLEKALQIEKGQFLSIFMFTLMQAKVEDLYAQFVLINEFASAYIQDGKDGSDISNVFYDLKNCIEYVNNLDGSALESKEQGQEYL